ncbi:MAG: phage holin family protein [Clostridiales bacterium]|jgi:hypothetical protein|nr:phage holin family protein [Clostridiales bacterium]
MFEPDKIWQTGIAVMLAVAGGLARLLNAKDTQQLQWGRILSELFISGFSGIMVLLLSRNFELSGDWIGVICGMAGWTGPRILDIIAKIVGKSIGMNVPIEQEEENNPENNPGTKL